jgi:hypothetical protein
MPHAKPADPLADYRPVGLAPRRDGWTAERQRLFLQTLAETGCISAACDEVDMTPRSAYRLRAHPNGALFARAWDAALLIATGRLMTLAFERAINGIPKSIWRDDKLVSETRQPSERLMMFLLTHLMPDRFGGQPMMNRRGDHRVASATAQLPGALEKLADVAPALCPSEDLCASDYEAQPPANEVA